MKVKLLKDLPFGVKAGTIATFSDDEYLFGYSHDGEISFYNYTIEEIKSNSDFFEVIEEVPVWFYEDFQILIETLGLIIFETKTEDSEIFHRLKSSEVKKRKPLIEAAPKMYRMLHSMATNQQVEIYEIRKLLKEIEK